MNDEQFKSMVGSKQDQQVFQNFVENQNKLLQNGANSKKFVEETFAEIRKELIEENSKITGILDEAQLSINKGFEGLQKELIQTISEAISKAKNESPFPLLIALVLLLSVSTSFYSLVQSHKLQEKWQVIVNEKIKEARELDSVIRFLKKQIEQEKTNAGQSHQSTNS